MTVYLIRLAIGRLVIWTIQQHGVTRRLLDRLPPDSLIRELIECDFCLGFWVFLVIPGVSDDQPWLIRALIDSMVSHLIGIGWKERFQPEIEYNFTVGSTN